MCINQLVRPLSLYTGPEVIHISSCDVTSNRMRFTTLEGVQIHSHAKTDKCLECVSSKYQYPIKVYLGSSITWLSIMYLHKIRGPCMSCAITIPLTLSCPNYFPDHNTMASLFVHLLSRTITTKAHLQILTSLQMIS